MHNCNLERWYMYGEPKKICSLRFFLFDLKILWLILWSLKHLRFLNFVTGKSYNFQARFQHLASLTASLWYGNVVTSIYKNHKLMLKLHWHKLQTTELCAKQDAYYREVVSELENRLKETIAGRDHVLALRYTSIWLCGRSKGWYREIQ